MLPFGFGPRDRLFKQAAPFCLLAHPRSRSIRAGRESFKRATFFSDPAQLVQTFGGAGADRFIWVVE